MVKINVVLKQQVSYLQGNHGLHKPLDILE